MCCASVVVQCVVQWQFVVQFVVVVVVLELLWVREVEPVLLLAPPSRPGMLWGKLPLSTLPRTSVGCLQEVEDVDASATAVVASVAKTCLVEEVGAEKVEDPDAKAKAARC